MLKRLFMKYIAEEARPMLRLATPIVMAELGWMTMGIVDTMMVGRQANSALAIGAVSLGGMLYYVVAIFGTGLMLGLDTLVSHSYGAGDMEDAHRSLVSVVVRRYLQGINLAKPVMFSLVTANLLNLVGNWALIYGHLGLRAMGTVGSGWATCIGRIYMAAFLMVYCVYHDLRYKTGLRSASRWPHMPRVWKLVSLGFQAATQLGLEVGVFAAVTALIGKLGAIPLASPQLALNTATF